MDDGILVDLTISDLEFIIKLLGVFKGSEKYLNYAQKDRNDFDNLVEKLKES